MPRVRLLPDAAFPKKEPPESVMTVWRRAPVRRTENRRYNGIDNPILLPGLTFTSTEGHANRAPGVRLGRVPKSWRTTANGCLVKDWVDQIVIFQVSANYSQVHLRRPMTKEDLVLLAESPLEGFPPPLLCCTPSPSSSCAIFL